jgi:uncharacterized phage infection (PIP) family protein YhgE
MSVKTGTQGAVRSPKDEAQAPAKRVPGKSKWSHCLLPATKRDIQRLIEIMSALSDELAAVKADLTTVKGTVANVATGVKALDDKITALQNSPGTLNPADQAALDEIQADSKALVDQVAAIDTTPPPAPSGN